MTDAGVFFFRKAHVRLPRWNRPMSSERQAPMKSWLTPPSGIVSRTFFCVKCLDSENSYYRQFLTHKLICRVSLLLNTVLITNSMLIMISLPAGRFEASRGEVCLGLALISMLGPCEASRSRTYRPLYSIIFLCCFEFFLFLLLLFMPAPHWHYLSE